MEKEEIALKAYPRIGEWNGDLKDWIDGNYHLRMAFIKGFEELERENKANRLHLKEWSDKLQLAEKEIEELKEMVYSKSRFIKAQQEELNAKTSQLHIYLQSDQNQKEQIESLQSQLKEADSKAVIPYAVCGEFRNFVLKNHRGTKEFLEEFSYYFNKFIESQENN